MAARVAAAGALLFPVFAQIAAAQPPQFRNSQPPPILDEYSTPSGRRGFTGTEGLTEMPEGAYMEDRNTVARSLFRNSTFPNGSLFAPDPLGPTVRTEDASASFKITLPSVTTGVPLLQRAFEPEDADLKVGPLFFKVRALEGAILHSDNVNLTEDNRESGTIAYTGLTVDIVAQLTETLRIASSVTFVYLPLDGKAGISGLGLTDFYNFSLLAQAGPLTHTQLAWETNVGGWHLVFLDDFIIEPGVYSNDFRSDSGLFQGNLFDEDLQSRTGRYSLGPAGGTSSRDTSIAFHNTVNDRNDVVVFSNTVSAEAERLDPGSMVLRARVYHENLWYNQGNRGLPSIRDGATISLISQRENTRFKPFFTYDLFHTDEPTEEWQHIFRAGLSGPITEQLFLYADAGYFTGGQFGEGFLWHVSLNHVAGPYTTESLTYARQFNYFHNEIVEGIGYDIHQILGPRLSADAYAYRLRLEDDFDGVISTSDQWRLGLRFTCNAGPRTTVQLTGEYASVDPNGSKLWTGRVNVGYNLTDTLLLQFIYQYQQNEADLPGQNYYENLFFLSLTKYFK